jgi:hypothetical protein
MRRHLSEQDALHHQAATNKRQAIGQLIDAETTEHRHTLMRQIIQSDAVKRQAEAHDGSWDCSFCKVSNPKGKHVAVKVGGVYACRGKAERAADDPERAESANVDLPPLVKDYPVTHPLYLYLCHECALAAGVVTREELETGRRQDDLNHA